MTTMNLRWKINLLHHWCRRYFDQWVLLKIVVALIVVDVDFVADPFSSWQFYPSPVAATPMHCTIGKASCLYQWEIRARHADHFAMPSTHPSYNLSERRTA